MHNPFDCVAPGVEEARNPGEKGAALAARLALEKARAVSAERPDAWVVGSDQVAILRTEAGEERIFGKPGTIDGCVGQLLDCSGRTLVFVTGVAIVNQRGAAVHAFTDTTRVVFRALDRATIERYVAREAPLDCAGGFKSEGLGITLCAAIDTSDPTALIGLPLIRLSAVLREVGFALP